MKSKIVKAAHPKPDPVVTLEQENRNLQIQLDTAKKKILTLQNKALKLELKSLEQEQKILTIELAEERKKATPTDSEELKALGAFLNQRRKNTVHDEPPEK